MFFLIFKTVKNLYINFLRFFGVCSPAKSKSLQVFFKGAVTRASASHCLPKRGIETLLKFLKDFFSISTI